MKSLVLDFGNSQRKIGLFNQDKLVQNYVISEVEFKVSDLNTIVERHHPDRYAITTTAHLTEAEKRWMASHQVMEVSDKLTFPFKISYLTPETLGRDRLAAVAGAYSLYRGMSCLIIDAGTCITYDLLTSTGDYLGGNIAPGVQMRLQSMHEYTDKLPRVEKVLTQNALLGNTTESAIQVGGIRMAVLEAESLIRRLSEKYENLNIVLTGGDADVFEKFLETKKNIQPNLILVGLNEILKYNEA